MATAHARWLPGVLALLAAAWFTPPAPAVADNDPLRAKILELNQLTGSATMDAEVKVLTADAANTRKLLAVAVQMTKEKDRPLNYNAAYVLGRAAQELKGEAQQALGKGKDAVKKVVDKA